MRPRGWLRLTPLAYAATPLGLGYGETRFASASRAFKTLYLGRTLETGVAETLIRDRFVVRRRRRLTQDEVLLWGVASVVAAENLQVLNLMGTGLVQLGVPTNAVRAKSHRLGRAFSEDLYRAAPDVDAILYPSRLTNGPCLAVYDRATPKLSAAALRPLANQPELITVLKALNIELI